MDLCQEELGCPGEMGYDNKEGSRDTLVHVWLHALCWIGWLWMVLPIYGLTAQLTLRMAQVIKRARNEASLEGLGRFFCELCQHMIERKIKKEQFVEYGRDWLHSESKTHAR